MNFNPDDPKWTAYILGELDASERAAEKAALEELLESSEEARTYLDELRVAAGVLEFELKAEFKSESTPGLPPQMNAGVKESLTAAQRAAIENAAASGVGNTGNLRWFPSPTSVIAALAVAALILIAVAMPSLWRSPRNGDSSHSVIADNAKARVTKEASVETDPNATPQATPTSPTAKPSGLTVTAAAGNANAADEKSEQSTVAENIVTVPAAAPASAAKSGGVATGIATIDPADLGTLRFIPQQATVTAPSAPAVAGARGGATAGSSISGNVMDLSNTLIPGVTVTAINSDTGVVSTALTNDTGSYRFDGLPPGRYSISASLVGFQTAAIANINLGSADTQRFNLAMKVGSSATTTDVAVNANSVLSQSAANVGGPLSAERVRALPLVGNDVLELLTKLQGVEGQQSLGQTNFAGISSQNVATVRDGLSVSDGRSQNGVNSTTVVSPDLVGEVKIILAPVDAELGRGNAQVQTTTRSGQNQYQGQQGQQAQQGQGQGQGQAGGGAAGGARGGGGARGAAAAAPPPPPPPPPSPPRPAMTSPPPPASVAAPRTIPDNPTVLYNADNFNRPIGGGTASYAPITDNPFIRVGDQQLSTFSSDVDTASYSNIRRFLNQNQLPPANAVRIEEMINYFTYDYPQPSGRDPIGAQMEVASAPWNPSHRLVRIAIKARDIDRQRRPPSNLVFLIDVSGSMQPPERLPLIKNGLQMMVNNLTENDHVSIVVYAGASGVVLPSTSGDHKDVIRQALSQLEAGGSTNGGAGILLAYQLADQSFIRGGVNRVILATDGDFNVGITSQNELTRLIQDRAKSGVFLSVLGVGTDNLRDSTMERLADMGNGNYAYLDSLNEANRVLVQQMSGTLVTVAKDVKLQVEFNPNFVEAYRLIGYENRLLAAADFNNDRKDAGDMGAGHTVTALYEIVPRGGSVPGPGVDPLKYQTPTQAPAPVVRNNSNETLTLKIRYKDPDGTESKLLSFPLVDREGPFSKATVDFRFAASVVEFGMILRDSPYRGNATLADALDMAQGSKGPDRTGYRQEFIQLVQKTRSLTR